MTEATPLIIAGTIAILVVRQMFAQSTKRKTTASRLLSLLVTILTLFCFWSLFHRFIELS